MAPSRKRSYIWLHFKETDDKTKVICSYCKKIFGIKNGSTGNMVRHLRLKHTEVKTYYNLSEVNLENVEIVNVCDSMLETEKTKNESLPNILSDSESHIPSYIESEEIQKTHITTVDNTSNITCIDNFVDTETMNGLIINMIIKGYHNFSIVDEPGFRNMICTMCPGYNIPDKKTIKYSFIPHLYFSAKELLKEKISEISSCCITTDSWKSSTNNIYMTVTTHYITDDSEITSKLLDCIILCEKYTNEDLTNSLEKVFTEWKINEKISVIITNEGQNIKNWEHMPCFLYLINKIVQAGLLGIHKVVNKVRHIIGNIKNRPDQERNELDLEKFKLKVDKPSNWQSTYTMLCKILQLKDIISACCNIDVDTLNSQEWTIIQQSTSVLTIFNEIANEIFIERIVPVSKVLVYINAIKKHMAKNYENISNEIKVMLRTLISQTNIYFKDFENNEFIMQAVLLDPRFKKYGFSNIAKYQAACNSLKTKVNSVEIETSTVVSTNIVNEDQNSLWNDFDHEVNKVMTVQNYKAACTREVDKYLDEIVINRTENPLVWWNERKLSYPTLYEIAKTRLCIIAVATSISACKISTKEEKILFERRTYIPPSKVAEVLFLRNNA